MKNIFFAFPILFFTWKLPAQSFSNDPELFKQEALQFLETTNTKRSLKIIDSFDESWEKQFNQGQKEKLIAIIQRMGEKRFSRANYILLFEFITGLPLIQKLLVTQIDDILTISFSSLETLSSQEYTNFQKGLNGFIKNQNLYESKFFTSKTIDPIYSFDYLEEAPTLSEDYILESSQPTDPPENDNQPSDEESWNDGANDYWPSDEESWDDDTNDYWPSDEESWDDDTDNKMAQINSNPTPKRTATYSYEIDYVALKKAKYRPAVITGPLLHLNQSSFILSSPFDSLKINNIIGEHVFKDRRFAGSSATIDWPKKYKKMIGAKIKLGDFNFRVDQGDFWTPNATLIFPDLFPDSIPGTFKYNPQKSIKQNTKNSLEFTSYENNITLPLFDGKVQYKGGIQLKGNELVGTAINKTRGELIILDGNGRKAIIRSEKFDFKDSVISAHNSEISIVVNSDSLYHPGIAMRYNGRENQLIVWREKKYDVTPFYDSYHDILISTDQLIWSMDYDSINFKMANGAGILPTTFESSDFFNLNRYQGLNGPYSFHPIGLSVFYAQKYGLTEFNEFELSSEYDLDILLVKGAMKILSTYGFANYDTKTGHVKLLPRAFLYYQAAANKRDFDNVFISSKMAKGFNASFNLDSMYLNINGVKKFWVTADYRGSITPENGKISMRENREIIFNGGVTLGQFDYQGRNFQFDYDKFLINLNHIDSVDLRLSNSDGSYGALSNHIEQTSGIVYLNMPNNRSGRAESDKYPYFVSNTNGLVFFNQPEILNGAYDSSIVFIVSPKKFDDIDSDSTENLIFPGSFNSGGIFPVFEDSLIIMEDQSLGFNHEIPKEGYNLYGTPARTYETIRLSNNGIRGTGKIDFIHSHLFSDDFIYYSDSVTTDGYSGYIDPGQVKSLNFPQADLGNFRMSWYPRKDSMYLITIGEPFNFYSKSAQLVGSVNLTQAGVYGAGSFFTRGSITESKQMTFEEKKFEARNSKFQILSDQIDQPAMVGENTYVKFNLEKNIAAINTEHARDAAFTFPYAAMKTSIVNANWFLEDSIVTMKKPDNVDLIDSYFYSTRPDLDSLVFNGTNAIYDIKTSELIVQGIPYILVADAKIVPENNETTIKFNSKLETFQNAKIIFESPELYHFLTDATINIISKNNFNAQANYVASTKGDTSKIQMYDLSVKKRYFTKDTTEKNTEIRRFSRKKNSETRELKYYTQATGITKSGDIEIAPGFAYKGKVTLKTYKQALELDGFIQPEFTNIPGYNLWVTYKQDEEVSEIVFDLDKETFEDGDPLIAGLHQDIRGRLYPTFIGNKKNKKNHDYFLAKGMVKYNMNSRNYIIEEPLKSTGEAYDGQTFIYNDSTQSYSFEGKMNFLNVKENKLKLSASVIGTLDAASSICTLDAALIIDVNLKNTVAELISVDLLDILARLGGEIANELNTRNLLKISNLIGDESTKEYQEDNQKEYTPLIEISELLNKFLVISGVKLNWNPDKNSWYSTSKIAISNIFSDDINTQVDGFLEIKKDDIGNDILNLFIQAAPGSWYYFNYQDNSLLAYSSNSDFNAGIKRNESSGKVKPGQLILVAGDETETLKYINTFRKVYLNIEAPFKLTYPDGFDEFLDISEDDDDGF